MKKFFVLLLLFVFVLSSCNNVPPGLNDINVSNSSLMATVDPNENLEEYTYVLNLYSRKFHLKNCQYAINMNPNNREVSNDLQYIMSMGFIPCSMCDPDRK